MPNVQNETETRVSPTCYEWKVSNHKTFDYPSFMMLKPTICD